MNQAWLIFSMVLSVILFTGGWQARGWKDAVEAAHLAESQQINTINAENAVIAKDKKAEHITTEVDTSYENKIKALESAYSSVSLRNDDPAQYGMPVISSAASRPDAAACPGKLTPANKAIIATVAKSSDQCVAKLVALQQWIKEQSK